MFNIYKQLNILSRKYIVHPIMSFLSDDMSQPKTDYTYSHSLSYRSDATPDRKVGSPNMSRQGIRNSTCSSFHEDSNLHPLNLRSRSIPRFFHNDIDDSSAGSEVLHMHEKLDYGLDESDSDSEYMAKYSNHQNPQVRSENGYTSKHAYSRNEILTKRTLRTSMDNNYSSPILQNTQNFPTYTSDDDRIHKVMMKKVSRTIMGIYYQIASYISSAFAFRSWSSHSTKRNWRRSVSPVNTTSQTTTTYVRNYFSSIVRRSCTYYDDKRKESPVLWWWLPLLMLLILSLYVLRWQYGEVYAEQFSVASAHLHSFLDRYAPKEFPPPSIKMVVNDGLSFISGVAFSMWVLMKEFLFLIGAASASVLTSSNHSLHTLDPKVANEIKMIISNELQSRMSSIATHLSEKNAHEKQLHLKSMERLQKEHSDLLLKMEVLSVQQNLDSTRNRGNTEKELSDLSKYFNEELMILKRIIDTMDQEIKRCCSKSYVTANDMRIHLEKMLGIFNESANNLMEANFVTKNDLDKKFELFRLDNMRDETEKNRLMLETLQKAGLSGMAASNIGIFNQSTVKSIVAGMLKTYDADRTGMVDHALESAGGTVVSTRCTEGYQIHFSEWFVMGIGFWKTTTNTPRSIIQSNRNPGDCWAFRGSLGYIVIQLTAPIKMTGFTVEHIPKSLSPPGNIDSAPRSFSVYGLHTISGESFKLGNYTFLDNNEPLQYFEVQNKSPEFFPLVELKIHSNHGNLVYTCVYRFRVHGIRSKEIY